jgi:hypothetical protein
MEAHLRHEAIIFPKLIKIMEWGQGNRDTAFSIPDRGSYQPLWEVRPLTVLRTLQNQSLKSAITDIRIGIYANYAPLSSAEAFGLKQIHVI